jgi:probable rRNA maturation factor
LRVTVTDELGRPVEDGGLAAWLPGIAPRRARGAVIIALVSERTIRRLNRDFRRKDAVTDVLSFPAGGAPVADGDLGEIAIARAIARKQARRLGHTESTEVKILALHGLLHLLGYDHEIDQGEMAALEDRLRRRAGLPRGLIERSHRAVR